jgi:hypothetical protein
VSDGTVDGTLILDGAKPGEVRVESSLGAGEHLHGTAAAV